MATSSFTKDFTINDPDEVRRFLEIISKKSEKPSRPINRELMSEERLARGRELLKKSLSR